jgi:hypothetical protein
VPAITPDELERAKWLPFMHADAADYGLWTFRCSISSRLTREVKIYRGRKRERRPDERPPDDLVVYKIDGVVVAYDPERICERPNVG